MFVVCFSILVIHTTRRLQFMLNVDNRFAIEELHKVRIPVMSGNKNLLTFFERSFFVVNLTPPVHLAMSRWCLNLLLWL